MSLKQDPIKTGDKSNDNTKHGEKDATMLTMIVPRQYTIRIPSNHYKLRGRARLPDIEIPIELYLAYSVQLPVGIVERKDCNILTIQVYVDEWFNYQMSSKIICQLIFDMDRYVSAKTLEERFRQAKWIRLIFRAMVADWIMFRRNMINDEKHFKTILDLRNAALEYVLPKTSAFRMFSREELAKARCGLDGFQIVVDGIRFYIPYYSDVYDNTDLEARYHKLRSAVMRERQLSATLEILESYKCLTCGKDVPKLKYHGYCSTWCSNASLPENTYPLECKVDVSKTLGIVLK
jgi:hypothetical protein